jgi:hypothetical protein
MGLIVSLKNFDGFRWEWIDLPCSRWPQRIAEFRMLLASLFMTFCLHMTLHRWLNGFSRFLPDASSCMTTLEERGRTLENRESRRKQLKDQQIMIHHDNTLKELADVPPFITFHWLYDALVPVWFLFCPQTHQGKFCTSHPLHRLQGRSWDDGDPLARKFWGDCWAWSRRVAPKRLRGAQFWMGYSDGSIKTMLSHAETSNMITDN